MMGLVPEIKLKDDEEVSGLEEGNLSGDVSGLVKAGEETAGLEEGSLSEDVAGPVLQEGAESEEENINKHVSNPVKLEAEEESAELEKYIYLDPNDPIEQLRLGGKLAEYEARLMGATINSILRYDALWRLAQRIENSKNAGFLSTAKKVLKSLEEWLLKSPSSCLDVTAFSRTMFAVWKDTRFVNDIRLTIEEDSHDLTVYFLDMSKEDPDDDRVDCMKFDYCLKTSLSEIEPDNPDPLPTVMTIRLFVSVLICHWTNKEVLTDLEEAMGKKHFANTIDWIASRKARIVAFKEKNVQLDRLSITVESIDRVDQAMEDLRNQLIVKHGVENKNIEATVTRVKSQLDVGLGVNHVHCGYDGKKVMVLLHGYEGRYDVASFGTSEDVLKY